MHRTPAVSRPAWMLALSGGGGTARRSPVEILANAASYVTRTQVADLSGLRAGPLGRWTDGVAAMRGDCAAFASHWEVHNSRTLTETGPLWVVLGDSTAQGLGAPSPDGGYVGQVLAELRQRTGQRWRVLNLSTSGALIRDVRQDQLPRLPAAPDLVTCGIGVNDILYTTPSRLFDDLRALVGALPEETVILDLPLPTGLWGSSAGSACPTSGGSTGPCTRRPGRAACRSPRCPPTSCRPGPGSSRPILFIPARPVTATGPGRYWPPSRPRRAGGTSHPLGKDQIQRSFRNDRWLFPGRPRGGASAADLGV